MGNSQGTHRWRFFRAGGVDQVLLRTGADVVNLDQLDQKLWVALACPTRGIEFDTRTLDYIDADKDGRVRVPEIIAAVKWAQAQFKDPDELFNGGDSVPLANIKDEAVRAAAKRVLGDLGKKDAAISLGDVADTARIFAATPFNGDGVVPVDSATSDADKQAIADILATVGGVQDLSGKVGVNRAKVDAFFAEAQALSEWHAKAETDKAILPLGPDATAAAAAAVKAVKAKVDDYFARGRLAAFDGRALAAVNRQEAEYIAIAAKDLSISVQEVAGFPLAKIEPGRPLPLTQGLNPAWADAMATLAAAVRPMLGTNKTVLTEVDWATVQARLAPYEAWLSAKPCTAVEALGLTRVRAVLASEARTHITDLIQQDLALEKENAQISTLEKLILFQRDLVKLLSNFVNFAEFYGRRGAVFQAGTLYLDSRACTLCLEVTDPGKHATLAGLSAAYLAYCDCTRPGGEKKTIVAAFTDGGSDNLIVGRNGVFYDRKGRDWDATITKIVANPISIREAFWAPYKKLVRMIEEQVAKRAAAADAASSTKLTSAAQTVAEADKAKPAAVKPPEAKRMDIGTVAAIGVALGSISTVLAILLGKFMDLGVWIPLGILALILLISGPSMLLAYLKLRQRNLGPILDASAWAINGRARINVPFGRALTGVARFPAGADVSLDDPYAEKRRPWRTYLVLVIIAALALLWYLGHLDRYLPGPVKSTSVMGTYAPAYKATVEVPDANSPTHRTEVPAK